MSPFSFRSPKWPPPFFLTKIVYKRHTNQQHHSQALISGLVSNIRWHDPYESPTRLQTSWIVCLLSSRITSRTFAIISGFVHVDDRPECLSPSTDSQPPLKHSNHSNVLAWLKACSPKASFSIRWVSAAVLLSLKQNLMQVLCSLTPAISIIADTCENGVKKTAKTRKHVHL